jgi:hypothetical protein
MDNNKFLENVLVFVDRNGTILDKHSTPMSTSLHMQYKQGDLDIDMHAFAHGMGNGSCSATITYQGEVVYQAGGSFTSSPYNVEVKKYSSGAWEQLMDLK